MHNVAEAKQKIIAAIIEVYKAKGLEFTMDDVAKQLSMSKKTIYKLYHDKEEMFLAVLDHVFSHIKDAEAAVAADEHLGTEEKLIRLLSVLPKNMDDIDFMQLYPLKIKYPAVYDKICMRLESDWDETTALIEKGIEEGTFRPVPIQIFRLMYSSAIERLLSRNESDSVGMSYSEALKAMAELLVTGLKK